MDASMLRRFVDEAGFIFLGKILGDRTLETPGLPPEPGEPLAVEIVRVLHSTDALRGLAGTAVTVLTRHAPEHRQRHEVIFFTTCISIGARLILREIGHVEASAESSIDVGAALHEAAERPLRERIASAELVVTGEVMESRPIDNPLPRKSEHDPLWWIARLAVKSALKGRKPRGEVEVLFANSDDFVWYKSPKLHREKSGIFILHRLDAVGTPREAPRTAYQATDPLDFLPSERLPEVERAIGDDKGDR